MIEAILVLLTLGSGHYVAHCRNAPEGCRARVTQYVHWAEEAAAIHRIDPKLMLAVAIRESGMDPAALGALGERGVYQLHPRGAAPRAERMCKESSRPLGWCQTYIAAQVLSRGLRTCDGSLDQALSYYNSGHCLPRYARKILRIRRKL